MWKPKLEKVQSSLKERKFIHSKTYLHPSRGSLAARLPIVLSGKVGCSG